MLIKTLQELKNGSAEALRLSQDLHEALYDLNSPFASGKPFSTLFEEQDSHDLMFYLLDKLTELTAKFSRQQAQNEGLTVSIELLSDIKEEKIEMKESVIEDLTQSKINREPGLKMYQTLKANALIGLNPFASMCCSTIQCATCGPLHQTSNWQLEYALTLPMN